MLKWLKRLCTPSAKYSESEEVPMTPDPHAKRGLYVVRGYGRTCELASEVISVNAIEDLINRIDWQSGVHQVICTVRPGVSMEVGGALNGEEGLRAMYCNRREKIECVITEPPKNPAEMIEILVSFATSTELWHEKYSFE